MVSGSSAAHVSHSWSLGLLDRLWGLTRLHQAHAAGCNAGAPAQYYQAFIVEITGHVLRPFCEQPHAAGSIRESTKQQQLGPQPKA